MDVAGTVRAVRRERGITQAQLAVRAGTTQTYISRVERGAVAPSLATLDRLLNAAGRRATLRADPLPCGNASPDRLRRDFVKSTPEERVEQAFELTSFLTEVACRGRDPAAA